MQFVPLYLAHGLSLAANARGNSANGISGEQNGLGFKSRSAHAFEPTLFCGAEHLQRGWPKLREATRVQWESLAEQGRPDRSFDDALEQVAQLEQNDPCFVLPRENERSYEVISRNSTYAPTAEDVGSTLYLLVQHVESASRTSAGLELLRAEVGQALDADVLARSAWATAESDVVIPFPEPPAPRVELSLEGSMSVRGRSGRANGRATGALYAMTFNVLAEIYSSAMQRPQSLADWAFAWPFRAKCLLRELAQYDADVVCLQELQADHYEALLPALTALGYGFSFKAKTREDMGTAGRIDGCATLYKSSRFRKLDEITVEFDAVALLLFDDQRCTSQDLGESSRAIQARKRLTHGNVALLQLLEERSSRRRLLLANTHLFWDPHYAEVKLAQALSLMRVIERRCGDAAVLIGADLNSTPDSAVYELLSSGAVTSRHAELQKGAGKALKAEIVAAVEPLEHNLELASAYAAVQGEEPAFTNYTPTFQGTLDYIWYSARHFRAVSCFAVPSEGELFDADDSSNPLVHPHGNKRGVPVRGLPNVQWPSDHLPMVAQLEFISERGLQ